MASTTIDKDYVLTDSSLNVYGMKLLTRGYKMDEYLKNPIGYYGHKKDDGVLLKWENVRLDGDRVIGNPVINMEHPRAERTIEEIKNGFLNAASVGKLCIIEYHLEEDPENPEEPIVVVDVWYNKECSLVDNPGNRNAMTTELCDEQGDEINLSDLIEVSKNKSSNMKKVSLEITPALLSLLSLSDDTATAEGVVKGIEGLHTENERLGAELKKEKQGAVDKRIDDVLAKGLTDGKFTKETQGKLKKAYANMPDELEDLVGSMPVYKSIAGAISTASDKGANPDRVKELCAKSWNDLDLSDELEELKQIAPAEFEKKFKDFKKKKK